jgi:hypothetical protein
MSLQLVMCDVCVCFTRARAGLDSTTWCLHHVLPHGSLWRPNAQAHGACGNAAVASRPGSDSQRAEEVQSHMFLCCWCLCSCFVCVHFLCFGDVNCWFEIVLALFVFLFLPVCVALSMFYVCVCSCLCFEFLAFGRCSHVFTVLVVILCVLMSMSLRSF